MLQKMKRANNNDDPQHIEENLNNETEMKKKSH